MPLYPSMQPFPGNGKKPECCCFTLPNARGPFSGREGSMPMRVQTRVLVPVTAMALLAAAGCAGTSGAAGSAAGGHLEKTTLSVAVVPAVDSAGVFVAL